MVELTGSEKQVKWANDIRKAVVEFIEEVEGMDKLFRNEMRKQRANENFTAFKETVINNDSAVFFIDNFQSLLKLNTNQYGENVEWANYQFKTDKLHIMEKANVSIETGANEYFEAAFLKMRDDYRNR